MRRDEKETDMDPLMNGIPQTSLPSGLLANAQLAPQGFFGNLLGQVGAPVGSAIGSALGNQGLGQTIGSVAGQLGRFLPFEAAPQFAPPQFAPQGFFGNLLGQVGAPVGSAGGRPVGVVPDVAAPRCAPQGFVGNLLGQGGAPVGSAIGSALGNQGLAQPIGRVAVQLGGFLPFEA